MTRLPPYQELSSIRPIMIKSRLETVKRTAVKRRCILPYVGALVLLARTCLFERFGA